VCDALCIGRTAILSKLNALENSVVKRLLTGNKLHCEQGIRLQIFLNQAEGKRMQEIASRPKIRERSGSEAVSRFNVGELQALLQQPPKKLGLSPVSAHTESEVCRIVRKEKPKQTTQWSTRELAERVGISHTSVHQIPSKHRLRPHLVKRFRTRGRPQFGEKLDGIAGAYLAAPENAIVLCVQEKSQITALERAQPLLALREKPPERQTRGYWRHGVTTLFGAFEAPGGKVIGDRKDRHRAQEYLQFLKLLDGRCPKE
jgi:transcriptional regulator with XRE-family HTH domain